MNAFELREKESNILSCSFYSSTAFIGNQFRMQFKAAAAITGSIPRIQADFIEYIYSIYIYKTELSALYNVLSVLGAFPYATAGTCTYKESHLLVIAVVTTKGTRQQQKPDGNHYTDHHHHRHHQRGHHHHSQLRKSDD